jgi:hypothetical protein
MPLWQLRPVDITSDHWRASTYKGEVIVRATSEREARSTADTAFYRVPDGILPCSPWKDPSVVDCQHVEGLPYDDQGPAAVVYPFPKDGRTLERGPKQPGPFTSLLIIPPPGTPADSPLFRPRHWRVSFLTPGDVYDVNLQELGTSPDQAAVKVYVNDPLGWQGYIYELFGTYERPESPPDAFRFQLLGPAGFSELRGPILDGPKLIAWRRLLYHEKSPVYLEAQWSATSSGDIIMRGLQRLQGAKVRKAMDYMADGLKLLQKIENRGRRRGPEGFDNEQEFEDTLIHLIQLVARQGQPTTQENVAKYLRKEIDDRRKTCASATQANDTIESTKRLIRQHSRYLWKELLEIALKPQ